MEDVTVFGGKKGDKKSNYSFDKKISTGIEALDKKIESGLPIGSRVLVFGDVATSKTIFSLNMILKNVNSKEKGLYITLDENIDEFLQNATNLDFKIPDKTLKVYDENLGQEDDIFGEEKSLTLDKLISELPDIIQTNDFKHIVIDPITSLVEGYNNNLDMKNNLKQLFKELIRLNLNSIICILDSYFDYKVLSPLFTSSIELKRDAKRKKVRKEISIKKIRGMKVKPQPYEFRIEKGKIDLLSKYRS